MQCNSSYRKRLFTMINDLPTIFEVVTGTVKKQAKEKPSVSSHNGNKSKSGSKAVKNQLTFTLPCIISSLILIVFKYHSCIIYCSLL